MSKVVGITVGSPLSKEKIIELINEHGGKGLTENEVNVKVSAAKKELIGTFLEYTEIVECGTEIIIDRNIFNVKYDKKPTIVLPNRFNYMDIPLIANSYNANHTLTHENNGLKIVRTAVPSNVYTNVEAQYVCEFSGKLWFSCDAKATNNVQDLQVKIKLNGVEVESMYGNGRVYCSLTVAKQDIVSILFYTCINNTEANTITYSNVMLQYGALTDFKAFGEGKIAKTVTLPTDANVYSTATVQGSTDLCRATINGENVFADFDSSFLPTNNDKLPNGVEIIGLPLVTYNETYNKVNGVGISSQGVVSIYIDGKGKQEIAAHLQENPVYITYNSTEIDSTFLKASSIVTCESNIMITGYSPVVKEKTINHVAMGDSITGMFGHDTSYPEMITRKSDKINSLNVGFTGSQITDHPNEDYKAFSFNRLVDAIVTNDWTSQDSAVLNIDQKYHGEHLTTLKSINFADVDYLTLFYGTNDWGNGVLLDTVKTVYTESIKKFSTAFPHIKIIVISPYWRSVARGKDSDVDANSKGEFLFDFADAIEELARINFNYPTVNYYRLMGANAITNRYYTQDGTHPTFSTREKIANDLIKVIENGKEFENPVIKGKDGKSAYDYAKESGYTGTEEEFAVLLSKMDMFTTDKVEELILEKSKKEHEIGSLYLSMNATNPTEIFGFGTWTLIAQDRFPIGAGNKYAAGDMGGEETHALTAKELPKQEGTIVTHGAYSGTPIADVSGVFKKEHIVEGKYLSGSQGTSANSIDVIGYSNGGEGAAHNNVPPFIAVYIWRRVA